MENRCSLFLVCVCTISVVCGCAGTPSQKNRKVLEKALSCAGLPARVEGFTAETGNLRSHAVTFHYVRSEPPGEFSVIRFARHYAEQHPYKLTDIQALLKRVGAEKEDFKPSGKRRLSLEGGSVFDAVPYTFSEAERSLHGLLAVWETSASGGGWVFVFNLVSPEKPPEKFVKSVVRALKHG